MNLIDILRYGVMKIRRSRRRLRRSVFISRIITSRREMENLSPRDTTIIIRSRAKRAKRRSTRTRKVPHVSSLSDERGRPRVPDNGRTIEKPILIVISDRTRARNGTAGSANVTLPIAARTGG